MVDIVILFYIKIFIKIFFGFIMPLSKMSSQGSETSIFSSMYSFDCLGGCGSKTNGSQYCGKTHCLSPHLSWMMVVDDLNKIVGYVNSDLSTYADESHNEYQMCFDGLVNTVMLQQRDLYVVARTHITDEYQLVNKEVWDATNCSVCQAPGREMCEVCAGAALQESDF